MEGKGNRFSGKVAVVTGGTSGLGRGVAAELTQEGAQAAILGRNEQAGREMEEAFGVRFYPCDVIDIGQIGRVFERIEADFGRVDILVNCAGVADHTGVLEITEEQWDRLSDTNLKGTFFCCQAAAKIMKASGNGGRIVNLGSLFADLADGRHTIYCATKAGVQAVTRSVAIALAKDGISCNAVSPAYVRTHMTEHNLSNPAWMEALRARVPQGRMVELREVVDAILFFCSEEASGITGQNLNIDLGWSVNA